MNVQYNSVHIVYINTFCEYNLVHDHDNVEWQSEAVGLAKK